MMSTKTRALLMLFRANPCLNGPHCPNSRNWPIVAPERDPNSFGTFDGQTPVLAQIKRR